jgi:hypothetical protein
MKHVRGWIGVTITVVVAIAATIGGICVTAVHFSESPNSFQMDVDAQPNRVQIRTRVQSKTLKTLSEVNRSKALMK